MHIVTVEGVYMYTEVVGNVAAAALTPTTTAAASAAAAEEIEATRRDSHANEAHFRPQESIVDS
jgi:hypothetical protein